MKHLHQRLKRFQLQERDQPGIYHRGFEYLPSPYGEVVFKIKGATYVASTDYEVDQCLMGALNVFRSRLEENTLFGVFHQALFSSGVYVNEEDSTWVTPDSALSFKVKELNIVLEHPTRSFHKRSSDLLRTFPITHISFQSALKTWLHEHYDIPLLHYTFSIVDGKLQVQEAPLLHKIFLTI